MYFKDFSSNEQIILSDLSAYKEGINGVGELFLTNKNVIFAHLKLLGGVDNVTRIPLGSIKVINGDPQVKVISNNLSAKLMICTWDDQYAFTPSLDYLAMLEHNDLTLNQLRSKQSAQEWAKAIITQITGIEPEFEDIESEIAERREQLERSGKWGSSAMNDLATRRRSATGLSDKPKKKRKSIPGTKFIAERIAGSAAIFKDTLSDAEGKTEESAEALRRLQRSDEEQRNRKVTCRCIGCSAPLTGKANSTVRCRYCDTVQVIS
jgi:hypothetical protein